MDSEIKEITKIWLIVFAVVASVSMIFLTVQSRQEISNDRYAIILRLKKIISIDPTNKSWNNHRKWLKDSTSDGYISNKEYDEYENLNKINRKQNLIYELRK